MVKSYRVIYLIDAWRISDPGQFYLQILGREQPEIMGALVPTPEDLCEACGR